ncbi:hypothetical protein K1719_019435 [Acacia pycnantha]|nr:hypothetical protein K1719_019435 [Acacia pycnantha]
MWDLLKQLRFYLRSLLDSFDSDGNSQNKLVYCDSAVAVERTQTVPFCSHLWGRRSHADYAIVNLEGSRHPSPLTTVYHKLQPTNACPYTFLQELFGNQYPRRRICACMVILASSGK